MALPTYDKTKRRKSFEQLPKGAYVISIIGAKEEKNKNGGGTHLSIAFDIAEGEYKGIYADQFARDTKEDKKWPYDAMYYINVPSDGCAQYIWDGWNTFFADLEDSNNGFIFAGDLKALKGKVIGGKFHNEQSEYNGNVYDHIRLKWTCPADDVRKGKPGAMPKDKLIGGSSRGSATALTDDSSFMAFPDSVDDEELPF